MNYEKVALYYDLLGAIYTGGGIRRAKLRHVELIAPGDRVLYLGAGTGSECVAAARGGALVTVVDLSHQMLQRARLRFQRHGLDAQFLAVDALELPRSATFDCVVAPFFLNVFDAEKLVDALRIFQTYIKPGGRFVSVDFRGPKQGHPLMALFQKLYYLPPLALFNLLTQNPWHELYDYEQLVASHAPSLHLSERLLTRTYGLPLLETLVWTRM